MVKVIIRNGERGRVVPCTTVVIGTSLVLRAEDSRPEQYLMMGHKGMVDVAVDILRAAPALQCATDPRLRKLAKMWLSVLPK